MSHTVYMTQWGEVAVSPYEAERLEHWLSLSKVPSGMRLEPYQARVIGRAIKRAKAKLADIERVAKWKYERESVS